MDSGRDHRSEKSGTFVPLRRTRPNGRTYLYAACSLHGDQIHSFRADRIYSAVRIPKDTFIPQWPIELAIHPTTGPLPVWFQNAQEE
jgi:hypothetical protein